MDNKDHQAEPEQQQQQQQQKQKKRLSMADKFRDTFKSTSTLQFEKEYPELQQQSSVYQKKLVMVGDGGCGKTSMLIVFTEDKFPDIYVPTVFENYIKVLDINGKPVHLWLIDTAGQEDYDRLRVFSYNEADIVLLCFAINSPDSFDNVITKWCPEVVKHCPKAHLILVGNKTDLREDETTLRELGAESLEPIPTSDGMKLAKKINALAYMECSAKNVQGVHGIFNIAVRAAVKADEKRRCIGKCALL